MVEKQHIEIAELKETVEKLHTALLTIRTWAKCAQFSPQTPEMELEYLAAKCDEALNELDTEESSD